MGHIRSVKQKKCIESKERQERNLAEMLRVYDKEVHPAGETLPDCVRVYCIKVVASRCAS